MTAKREFNGNALNNVLAKCEQYWNEHGIYDSEVHAILEFIHREASKMEPLLAACEKLGTVTRLIDNPTAQDAAWNVVFELHKILGT